MDRYIIALELISPTIVSVDRQSRTPEALNYIPGATVRGAIAAQYIRRYGNDEVFADIFLSGRNIFPNLYAAPDANQLSRVIPVTALSCKRKQGFEGDGHGVKDVLFLKGAIELYREENGRLPEKDLDDFFKCYVCGSGVKSLHAGFWNGSFDVPATAQPQKQVVMHTGIDRATGTVADGVLFGIEAIDNTRTRYMTGMARFEKNAKERIMPLIVSPVFLGKAKTRGYGEGIITISPIGEPGHDQLTGLREWSERFIEYASAVTKSRVDGFFFAVGLESDAIVLDRFLRYTNELDAEFAGNGLECIYRSSKMVQARGWNHAHRLPKEDEWAVEKGSVYLYRYRGRDIEALLEKLQGLQDNGIGVRREEGYGRITISNQFHVRFS